MNFRRDWLLLKMGCATLTLDPNVRETINGQVTLHA
jgi:hypothetical protein